MVKKRSVSIQVDEEALESISSPPSRFNKFDQSTEDEIKLRNSGEKKGSIEKTSPYKHLLRTKNEFRASRVSKK